MEASLQTRVRHAGAAGYHRLPAGFGGMLLPAPGVTDAPHSQTKLSGGKKSAGAATKGAGGKYLMRQGNNNSGGL